MAVATETDEFTIRICGFVCFFPVWELASSGGGQVLGILGSHTGLVVISIVGSVPRRVSYVVSGVRVEEGPV